MFRDIKLSIISVLLILAFTQQAFCSAANAHISCNNDYAAQAIAKFKENRIEAVSCALIPIGGAVQSTFHLTSGTTGFEIQCDADCLDIDIVVTDRATGRIVYEDYSTSSAHFFRIEGPALETVKVGVSLPSCKSEFCAVAIAKLDH